MIVRLRKPDDRAADLSLDTHYLVIGIESDDYRLLGDQGRPYLYPADLFEIIDPSEPEDWIVEQGEDSERYAYPAELASAGFFEDFFDARQDAVATFWRIVNRRLVAA